MKTLRIGVLLAACSMTLLAGCATTGGAPRSSSEALAQIAVQAVIVTAVDRVVSRDHATLADIEHRATRIVNVASALKALGSDALSTLPQINEALSPLLERLDLTPLERAQANLLVSALVAVALERTDVSGHVSRVSYVLDEVIRSASAYLPEVGLAPSGLDRLELALLGGRRRILHCS